MPTTRGESVEGDFGALIAPGLELAFDERHEITLDGHTLNGEAVRRTIPVSGPATCVVLKSFAFADRGEPKDAYDLIYVLRRWPGGASDITDRLAAHAKKHPGTVQDALGSSRTTSRPWTNGPRPSKEALPGWP